MRTHPSPRHAARRQRGFSLIEIMVGLVIAMIGVIIMMEVLITSEQRTRTTNSGNDALSSGAVMAHMIQRDLAQAGYGINSLALLGCNVQLPTGTTSVPLPLVPVVINPAIASLPAADANTDVLLVAYGNGNGQPEGNAISGLTGNDYTVQAPSSFSQNDYVLAYTGSCAAGSLQLAKVTAPPTLTTVTVDTVDPAGATLYDMGQSPRFVGYMVRSGSLTSCDFLASDCTAAVNWQAVAGNIVSLRAEYGRDTAAVGSMDGIVDVWDQTTPTTSCTWARASAVRFGIVARSAQYETKIDTATKQRICDQVTAAAPLWSGSSTAPFVPPFAGSTAAEWQCYRYKTFENIAPTRNIVWMGTQAGC